MKDESSKFVKKAARSRVYCIYIFSSLSLHLSISSIYLSFFLFGGKAFPLASTGYAGIGIPLSSGDTPQRPAKGLLPLAHARRSILGFPNFQSLRSLQVG